MFMYSFTNGIRQGIRNIFKNGLFSLASIGTITACLFLFGVFYCMVVNFQHIFSEIETTVGVTVFFDEGKEFGVNLYRRGFLYTEQMMINDDINILNDMSRKASDSAYRTLNKAVYDVLFNGANIYDGKGLFHADHHNSAGTASKVSIKSLAEGEKAMRKQKDISGQAILDIRPSILLCEPYVGIFAGQLIGSSVDPSYNNAVPNPMKGKYQIVTDPVLFKTNAN